MNGTPPSPVASAGAQMAPGGAIPADVLARLVEVIESRRGADPAQSYVAKLFHKGADAILKKVGEEATEVVLAAKAQSMAPSDEGRRALVGELADLWFHTLVAMAHLGLQPADVLQELARREGLSGLEEFARRAQPPSPDDARG